MNSIKYFNAIFTYEKEGISIIFPDLPGCISCGYSEEEAIQMAKEALQLYFDGSTIANILDTDPRNYPTLKENQKIVRIEYVTE